MLVEKIILSEFMCLEMEVNEIIIHVAPNMLCWEYSQSL